MSTFDADLTMEAYRELNGRQDSILWLFHGRCVMCGQKAEEVNEIVPRARTREALNDYHNQVPLCHLHHVEFHRNGVTAEKQDEMRQKREEFLRKIGRENYI